VKTLRPIFLTFSVKGLALGGRITTVTEPGIPPLGPGRDFFTADCTNVVA
jgi:hypothetical protein